MKTEIVYKIFGLCSILFGGINYIYFIIWALFIDYFAHPGPISKIGLLVCYTILIIAGILLFLKRRLSILLYFIFCLFLIFDRIFAYMLYIDYFPYLLEEYLAPFLVEIPILIFLLYFHLKTLPKLKTDDLTMYSTDNEVQADTDNTLDK